MHFILCTNFNNTDVVQDIGSPPTNAQYEGEEPVAGVRTDEKLETDYGPRTSSYNLRPRQNQKYRTKELLVEINEHVLQPQFTAASKFGSSPSLEPLAATMMIQYGI